MQRTRALILLAVVAAGCASLPTQTVPPGQVHPVSVGVNDGYHGVLPPDVFAQDCPHMIRTPQVSGEALRAFLDAIPEGCAVLPLVEAPDVDLAVAMAGVCLNCPIELGNELELKPYELTPAQYADWIDRALARLVKLSYLGDVVLGGVYAITPETKDAITRALSVCDRYQSNCVVGDHLYDASDEDLVWLRSLQRRIWVTEFGFPTRCQSARLQQQADYLTTQLARFSTVPLLERAFISQRADGPTCSDLDSFGIAGKPAQSILSH